MCVALIVISNIFCLSRIASAEEPPPPPPVPAVPQPAESAIPPLSPLSEAPPLKPRGKFQWDPVKIGGREYVSASSIATFFDFPQVKKDDAKGLTLRSSRLVVEFTGDTREMRINNVKFILNHAVILHQDEFMISRRDLVSLIHPIVKPAQIPGTVFRTVVIDAADGDRDGAGFALDVARRLQKRLESEGFKVVQTRPDDVPVPDEQRLQTTEAQDDAIVVQLRYSTEPNTASGVRTFFPDPPAENAGPDQAKWNHLASCTALATALHAAVLFKSHDADGGIQSGGNGLINQTRHPVVVFDAGDPKDSSESDRQTLAEGLAMGIQNFRKALLSSSTRGSRTPQRK